MATYKVSGTEYSIADKLILLDSFQCSISETNTRVTFKLEAGTQFKNKRSTSHVFAERTLYLTGTGQTTASGTIHEFALPGGKSKYYEVIDRTWTYTKSTTATTKTISAYTSGHSATKASKVFTIPALKSYAVTYNANGGTGAPTSQTKYYGQALTITTSKPTRTGYTFKGWATTSARADAGYIDYASGASYTSNSALTLYAVWELNYVKPIITNVSVERCKSNGVLDDEGKYARVTFDWSIDVAKYPSNTVNSLTITVGSITVTPSVSGSSGTVANTVGTGTYDTDTSYAVTITLTDTSGETVNYSTWTGALGLTKFPLDISADGNSVGICRPAPDNTHGIFLGDNLDVNGNVTANNIGAKNWVAPSAVSCQTGKWYKVAEVTLDPGIWFIDCNAYFPKTNTTGVRQIRVTTATFTNGTTTTPASYGSIGIDVQMGANTAQYPQAHFPVDISSQTTFRLAAYQDSNSTMSVTGRMYATRIK